MKIIAKKVGIINYTLKNGNGDTLDTSEGGEPLSYIHGMKNLIPGMEKVLEGREPGEKFNTVIPSEEAYGNRKEDFVNQVPLSNFPEKDSVKAGVQFEAKSEQGSRIATVVDIQGETVTVDFNHPLAGETLHFEVEVVDVRDATSDELSHGHVHTGCCDH